MYVELYTVLHVLPIVCTAPLLYKNTTVLLLLYVPVPVGTRRRGRPWVPTSSARDRRSAAANDRGRRTGATDRGRRRPTAAHDTVVFLCFPIFCYISIFLFAFLQTTPTGRATADTGVHARGFPLLPRSASLLSTAAVARARSCWRFPSALHQTPPKKHLLAYVKTRKSKGVSLVQCVSLVRVFVRVVRARGVVGACVRHLRGHALWDFGRCVVQPRFGRGGRFCLEYRGRAEISVSS